MIAVPDPLLDRDGRAIAYFRLVDQPPQPQICARPETVQQLLQTFIALWTGRGFPLPDQPQQTLHDHIWVDPPLLVLATTGPRFLQFDWVAWVQHTGHLMEAPCRNSSSPVCSAF